MASGGHDAADSIPTPRSMDDPKIQGSNSKKPIMNRTFSGEQETSSQKHHEKSSHGLQNKAVPYQSSTRPCAPQPSNKGQTQIKPRRVGERIEDVFQDEIVQRFPKMTEFKKFARSSSGLRLSDYDVESIMEDYRQAEEQKLQMLYLWKQKKGKNATPDLIRKLVDEFFDRPTYYDQD